MLKVDFLAGKFFLAIFGHFCILGGHGSKNGKKAIFRPKIAINMTKYYQIWSNLIFLENTPYNHDFGEKLSDFTHFWSF